MGVCQPREYRLGAPREVHEHPPPVGSSPRSADQASRLHAVDELDCGVVLDLQPLGNEPDRGVHPRGHALHREQELVLLRLETDRSGRAFAETLEPAQLITELRQRSVVRDGEPVRRHMVTISCYDRTVKRPTRQPPTSSGSAPPSRPPRFAAGPTTPGPTGPAKGGVYPGGLRALGARVRPFAVGQPRLPTGR